MLRRKRNLAAQSKEYARQRRVQIQDEVSRAHTTIDALELFLIEKQVPGFHEAHPGTHKQLNQITRTIESVSKAIKKEGDDFFADNNRTRPILESLQSVNDDLEDIKQRVGYTAPTPTLAPLRTNYELACENGFLLSRLKEIFAKRGIDIETLEDRALNLLVQLYDKDYLLEMLALKLHPELTPTDAIKETKLKTGLDILIFSTFRHLASQYFPELDVDNPEYDARGEFDRLHAGLPHSNYTNRMQAHHLLCIHYANRAYEPNRERYDQKQERLSRDGIRKIGQLRSSLCINALAVGEYEKMLSSQEKNEHIIETAYLVDACIAQKIKALPAEVNRSELSNYLNEALPIAAFRILKQLPDSKTLAACKHEAQLPHSKTLAACKHEVQLPSHFRENALLWYNESATQSAAAQQQNFQAKLLEMHHVSPRMKKS